MRPNYDTQEVYFDIKPIDDIRGENIRIDVYDNNVVNTELLPLYDDRRNLLIQNDVRYISILGDELKGICSISDSKGRTMRILAWVLLGLYALTFVLLLIWSCLCWKRYNYGQLFGYWKFFLHMWCKLQMVAFFFVLA